MLERNDPVVPFMRMMFTVVIIIISMIIVPVFGQDQKTYLTENGLFENPYCDEDEKPDLTDMVHWKISYHILQKPFISDDYQYTIVSPEYVNLPEKFHSGMITWVGYSTYLIQVDGINILTDPVWSERVGLLGGKIGHQRYTPPGVPWEKLPPIDVAMIPIGAYEPRWYNGAYHLDPGEAIQTFEDLNARYFASMHWGTFDQAEELLGDPPRELLSHAAQRGYDLDTIWVFAFGESRAIPPREK